MAEVLIHIVGGLVGGIAGGYVGARVAIWWEAREARDA